MADREEGVGSGLSYSVLEDDKDSHQPSYRPSALINSGPAANRTTLRGCVRASVPHLVIVSIYLAYIFGGGGVFLAIQRGQEATVRDSLAERARKFEKLKAQLGVELLSLGGNNAPLEVWNEFSKLAEQGFIEDMLNLGGPELTYMGSVLYCLAIITTIDAYEYSPFVHNDKALIVLYALLGIPLSLVFLIDMGNLLARLVNAVYSRCRCRRGNSSRPSGIYRGTSEPVTSGHQPGCEPPTGCCWQETEWGQRDVPVLLVLAIWLVYFLLASIVIAAVEKSWYGRGLFVTFVSSTTISLGELLVLYRSLQQGNLIFVCLVQILVSLCVMSMCVILLLPKIVRAVSRISSKFNL